MRVRAAPLAALVIAAACDGSVLGRAPFAPDGGARDSADARSTPTGADAADRTDAMTASDAAEGPGDRDGGTTDAGGPPPGDARSRGRELWLGFMENLPLRLPGFPPEAIVNGLPRVLVWIETDGRTRGTVDMPRRSVSIPFAADAAGLLEIELPIDPVPYLSEAEGPSDFGVVVRADRAVGVRAVHLRPFFSEVALVLPVEELGADYVVIAGHDEIESPGDLIEPSSLLVVATRDGTTVQISPSAATLSGRPARTPFTVRLDAGQTYQLQAVGDLSGTALTASAPIAVYAGARTAEIRCEGANSHLFDVNLPLHRLGTRYTMIPFAEQGGDVVKIVAAHDDTTVRVDCGPPLVLSRGQIHLLRATDPTSIRASRPIAVAQFDKGQSCNASGRGDPSMMTLLPDALTDARGWVVTLDRPARAETTEDLVADVSAIGVVLSAGGRLTIDGVPVAPPPAPLPGDPGRAWWRGRIPSGRHPVVMDPPGILTSYGFGEFDGTSSAIGYDCVGCVAALAVPATCP